MRYKAVLYDMDGTVLNTLGDLTDSVNYTLRHFSMPERSADEVRSFLGNGAGKLIEKSVPSGTDSGLFQEVLSFYKVWYNEHSCIKTAPYGGITGIMKKLKSLGVKQAVVSNKPDMTVRELAGRFFAGLLETAVGESSAVRRKPWPDTVDAAVKLMGVDKKDCVYVGDSEVDIATAKNAGMDCISVAWGFRSERELRESGAECIVHDMDEFFRALC
ncbi:MAG: HAD family hydrolase [Candidatus Limivicinus sp.]|jgi:phosphoglycolate phosphatase